MKQREAFNPKRRISAWGRFTREQLTRFVNNANYNGNPEHKQRPADYGLSPPSSPRPGKTLCDGAGELAKPEASELLRRGFEFGMLSEQIRNGWPQNVWCVKDGQVFEAQLENATLGTYHGYPVPFDDQIREKILEEWKAREHEIDH